MASADVKSSEGFRMSHAVKAPYVPFYRSAPYPTIGVNFRKLQGKTLYKYCVANGINVREDSTQSELAVACARHFEAMKIEEANGIIGTFLHKCTEEAMAQPEPDSDDGADMDSNSGGSNSNGSSSARTGPGGSVLKKPKGKGAHSKKAGAPKREEQELGPILKKKRTAAGQFGAAAKAARARNGEQIAVLDEADGERNWILARVHKYHADVDEYECQDEDDSGNIMHVASANIIKLEDSTKNLDRNDDVLAVFPETTSFYKAQVYKIHRVGATTGSSSATSYGNGHSNSTNAADKGGPVPEILVKFNDDQDDAGNTNPRRVLARYVIPVPVFDKQSNSVTPPLSYNSQNSSYYDDDDNNTSSNNNAKGHGRGKRQRQ